MYYSLSKFIVFTASMLAIAACSFDGLLDKPSEKMPMTFGNSDNVKIIQNPVMMFHDVIVKSNNSGADLVGKIHVMQHTRYVPGHVDIAVVDNQTKKVLTTVSTDFNHRIAEWGRSNLNHPNNLDAEIPNVNPEEVTHYVAYHPSNIDRASKFDCGDNAALAAVKKISM